MSETEQQEGEGHIGEQFSGVSLVSVFGGHRLHPTTWAPTEPPKALVCICHGFGEYMGRHDELGSYLSQYGVLVFGHDHVGHGRSEGERVHVEDGDTYVQDVIHHVELMKNKYPHLPCILMGHSMGGLIAGHVIIQQQNLFTSAILSAASAKVDPKYSNWLVSKVFKLLGHVAPQLGIKGIDPNDISSIPEEIEKYVNDPLIWHGAMKARWGAAMLKSASLFRENATHISLPLLLIHGTEDRLVPIAASHFIHDNTSSKEKNFEVFDGSRHDVLYDKERERAKVMIKDWVLAHLRVSEPSSDPTSTQSKPTESEPEETVEEQASIPQEKEPEVYPSSTQQVEENA